ncbi:MAG TPA: hypothetical protein VGC13_09495 [Longimicrobium sp.]|jgi:hypothetical protein|uniref:hypothetical protein n=1 Tax=Longimicrobium sp. TaxID=2029185 RepID=UPI002ED847BF
MRSKLSLNLEDLSVDSFDTTSTQKAKGTVFGEQCTCYTNCTCPGCPTCYASCNGTCDNTCANTCDDASCVGCTDAYSCYFTDCGIRCGSQYQSACNGAACP